MVIKVLAIDDDPQVTRVYRDGLPAQEFEVFAENSGSAGIELARRVQPDVIILDLMMPEMNGWEVCRVIRTFSQVPILMISAVVESEGVMQALEAGANDYIIKPVPLSVLATRLKRLMRQARIDPKETNT